MAETKPKPNVIDTKQVAQDILQAIEREREREIISRRFGLFDRKETLEQIGEILGITRERVRQLEKSVITKLKVQAEKGELKNIASVQQELLEYLGKNGQTARIASIGAELTPENSRIDQSRIAFLGLLCPKLGLIEEDDKHFAAISVLSTRDEKAVKTDIAKLVTTIKAAGQPQKISEIAKNAFANTSSSAGAEATALANLSKQLATLNGQWGLVRWPTVNPKNIRDKIYVILKHKGSHMHFNDIAKAIKDSDFKRKDVTTQAIHNELIKDKRFVLIGRGLYALKEWGFKKGTVAEIISEVLREAGEPLHRDEIVRRVMKSRFVKDTTILLNLQGKSQFRRVAKATYTLDEAEATTD